MRYGVHGSALPGFITTGIFSTVAGAHSECTPGELFGSTTPSEWPRGNTLIGAPPRRADALRRAATDRDRASGPPSTSSTCDSTPWILRMLRRTITCGMPVVAESWRT